MFFVLKKQTVFNSFHPVFNILCGKLAKGT